MMFRMHTSETQRVATARVRYRDTMASPERDKDWIQIIGDRLARTRKALELTQEQLADELGVSRGALGNWEQGTRLPDPAAMMRFANRYGVSMDWIYRGDPSSLPQRYAANILGRTSRRSKD